ncbi:hypothetical protein [Microcoleus sp. FACHB-672]|uniref:hypothetical protein n=1 Tax=Microcoleus sp. FACHB-672 TaxID=2692825 RepID=UPI0016889BB2|nr:hypothetical protein [Microcoleus sp. FACHB-672]MBD2040186.1 hypothetical protein [Microcoleus sp. FACHB-672]
MHIQFLGCCVTAWWSSKEPKGSLHAQATPSSEFMQLYSRLSTRSRRAISRRTWHGRPYDYRPRGDLLVRLSKETGLSISGVYEQLQKERREILQYSEFQ